MRLEWFVGARYLLSSRKNAFLSIIAILSIIGIAAGVGFLIMVISVMAGFEDDFREKILGLDAHIIVQGTQGLRQHEQWIHHLLPVEEVKAVTPFIEGEVLLASGERNRGALMKGIDVESAMEVTDLEKTLEGNCSGLTLQNCFSLPDKNPPLLVGSELYNDLRLYFESDHDLKVISPLGHFGPFGFEPRLSIFHVVGSFRSGFYEYDTQRVYVPLKVAQQFFLSGSQVTGLEVKVQDEYQSSRIKEKIRKKLQTWQNTLPPEIQQPFRVTDWQERNEKLFSALKLEKLVMFIVLMLIVVVASFIILVTMAMLVLEKKGEIAILRTMGVPQYKITRLFIMDGALIGICGAVLGFLGGLFLCFLLSRYHFVELPPQYYVTTLPIVIHWPDIILITLSSIVIAIGATFYPAYNAGQMNSVEILRYE